MARKMKDSGVEWIGMIPDGWSIHRLKSCVLERDSGAWGSDASGDDGDMVCLRIADFDYGRYKFKDVENPVRRNYDKATIERLILKKNDLLVEKSGGGDKTPVGRMVMFDKDYPALYANFMDRLRCRDFVVPKWFLYLWNTFYSNGYVWNYIKQTTGLQNYDLTSMLAGEKVALPTLIEQRRIVDYLDAKCASIDGVIAKTNESIEEYKKLKQAVITEVVTKGVRGKRPMKDSGIDWIGQIPEGWNVVKITRILDDRHPYAIGDGDHGLISPSDYVSEGVPYIRVQNLGWGTEISSKGLVYISEETNKRIEGSTLHPGDVLFAKTGATIGKTGIIPEYFGIANTTSHVGKITVAKNICPKFIMYILASTIGYKQFWDIASQKSTRPELAINEIKAMKVLVPPNLEEQREIADYLDSKCAAIDTLISKKQQFIDELTAYKKSLIYEYVTGKKEVPA